MNRSFFSVPNYAMPYNQPAVGIPFTPACGSYPTDSGWIYHLEAGSFGNCAAGPTGNKRLPPWDFVCPKGRPCFSMTSPMTGMQPNDICCGINGFSSHPSNSILGPLPPAVNFIPGRW